MGWQPMQAPLDVPQPKKTPERYVAMDRRTELAQQQRQQVPELAKLPDDQIVEKFVTQFPTIPGILQTTRTRARPKTNRS